MNSMTCYNWDSPEIGTCGFECDVLRIDILRVRAIPPLLLKFDGERNGWVIGGSFRTEDGEDFEFKEVSFIPENDLEENKYYKEKS